ncbi:MAG: NERD domain-containing protein [Deltaproteobacteria bacterium]|nr:NERD domain-containing protein [Deltaproteobacteria bacterium]MBW2011453.1 NERD domain-containing protein [Deltaproteobacteria bacterium]
MKSLLIGSLPLIILFVAFGILISLIFIIKFSIRKKKRRLPFTENFLRSPGQSLIKQIDDINDEISSYLFCALTLPIFVYAIHISQSYFGNAKETASRIITTAALAIGLIVFSAFKLMKSIFRRRELRLGCDGELVVGQELNQLMLNGYCVYHDFPADKFNIDHIVVGPAGVFAIETKARRKPISGNGTADAKVTYDGRQLKFPHKIEVKSIQQSKRQAKWLSQCLSKAIGTQVSTIPALLLPGWFVERIIAPDGLLVMNPKFFCSWVVRSKNRVLSQAAISQISHQLEQKCRDVKPVVNFERQK